MDPGLNRKSLMFGVPGIALQIAGVIVQNARTNNLVNAFGGTAILIAGTALLVWGLGLYAKAKGHSRWFGLFGLLSCVGLIILAALPDRLKDATPKSWVR